MAQPGTSGGNANTNQPLYFLREEVTIPYERRHQAAPQTLPSLTSSTGTSQALGSVNGPTTPGSSGPTTLFQSLQEPGSSSRKRRRTSSPESDVATLDTSSTGHTMVEDQHRHPGSDLYAIGLEERLRLRESIGDDDAHEITRFPMVLPDQLSLVHSNAEEEHQDDGLRANPAGDPTDEQLPPPHPTVCRLFKAVSAATFILVAGAGVVATIEKKPAPVKIVIVSGTVASVLSTFAWMELEPSWEKDKFGAISAIFGFGSLVLAVVH